MKSIWKDGILGVLVGDALGCPVQFESREEVATHPVTDMRGYGTFRLPAGSWTDDSSLTLALLDSIVRKDTLDLNHIMQNFVAWLDHGAFTPFGYSYDIGGGTMKAIRSYKASGDPESCGGRQETNNGNGSLMRIIPACLYCWEQGLPDQEAIRLIHAVGSLTHAHIRANIACGLYYFMISQVLSDAASPLAESLQRGLDRGFAFYEDFLTDRKELSLYDRLRDLITFAAVGAERIRSGGYVVDTLEAAVWSLITTSSFREALLKAVNLGEDTDTVGAIAGGLGALFYGTGGPSGIPGSWIDALQKKDMILSLCAEAQDRVEYRGEAPAPGLSSAPENTRENTGPAEDGPALDPGNL